VLRGIASQLGARARAEIGNCGQEQVISHMAFYEEVCGGELSDVGLGVIQTPCLDLPISEELYILSTIKLVKCQNRRSRSI
jgi:hypothetical protein